MTFHSSDTQGSVLEWNEELINQLELELSTIEKILTKELQTLEESLPPQPEEEVPQTEPPPSTPPLLHITRRIKSTLLRRNRAEGRVLREQRELQEQLSDQQALYREMEMERDVLLQQVHSYLQTNSSLRVRLEEQRCQTGAAQRQLNADLEARIAALENDKERLSEVNAEKDKKIHELYLMLEQTAKCLQKRESEVMKLKNNENNLISSLKADLQVALEDKAKTEEKYRNLKGQIDEYFLGKSFERLTIRETSSLKKSLSMGDVCSAPFDFSKADGLEPHRHPLGDGALSFKPPAEPAQSPKQPQPSPAQRPDAAPPLPPTPDSKPEKKPDCSEPPVHTQLNALKRGLLNVTRKLEILKCQLVSSGAIEEGTKPLENPRSLKRKASVAEEAEGSVAEDPKSGFRNLRSILEDAKSLNAKLQSLREEKQRIIELSKRDAGTQACTKKNDKVCQTTRHPEPPTREYHGSLTKLRKALGDCEEKLDSQEVDADEARAWFLSAVSAFVSSVFEYLPEWVSRTDCWFSAEIDTGPDEGPNRWREATSPGENGGGDNLLRKQILRDGPTRELHAQIERLRRKTEQRLDGKKFDYCRGLTQKKT